MVEGGLDVFQFLCGESGILLCLLGVLLLGQDFNQVVEDKLDGNNKKISLESKGKKKREERREEKEREGKRKKKVEGFSPHLQHP